VRLLGLEPCCNGGKGAALDACSDSARRSFGGKGRTHDSSIAWGLGHPLHHHSDPALRGILPTPSGNFWDQPTVGRT